jgi:hypothetical protein
MSTGPRQRTVCQACGKACRVRPLEVMLRNGHGWRGHWVWGQAWLCPRCQPALFDLVGQLELQEEDVEEETLPAGPAPLELRPVLPPVPTAVTEHGQERATA